MKVKSLAKKRIWRGTPVIGGPVASSVQVIETTGTYSLAYVYSGGEVESNKPPAIDTVTVISTPDGFTDGDTLSVTIVGFKAFDGNAEGTHLYQWYKASDIQDTGLVAIAGATSATYLIVTADIGDFIYCKVTPVQTGSGTNLQGTPVKSFYTKQIVA